MTDQEITRLIAEKLMGWNNAPTTEYVSMDVHTGGEFTTKLQLFNPLTNDNDCMAAWDKFSVEHGTVLYSTPDGWDVRADIGALVTWHEDRRRAMCECMAKAVS